MRAVEDRLRRGVRNSHGSDEIKLPTVGSQLSCVCGPQCEVKLGGPTVCGRATCRGRPGYVDIGTNRWARACGSHRQSSDLLMLGQAIETTDHCILCCVHGEALINARHVLLREAANHLSELSACWPVSLSVLRHRAGSPRLPQFSEARSGSDLISLGGPKYHRLLLRRELTT